MVLDLVDDAIAAIFIALGQKTAFILDTRML
jgi:hypothetical protein